MTTLSASAVFPAISWNEVRGNANAADSIRRPLNSGTSGWTVGFDQEDFNAGSGSGKGSTARTTLATALEASGEFDATDAQNLAQDITNAGTSSTLNLAGIKTINGTVLTNLSQNDAVELINTALQTAAGSNSIFQSSLNNFTSNYNTLTTNVFESSSLLPEVQTALADATYGPLLQIVLADYANQYGPITTNGPMFHFLAGGVQTVGGNTLTMNTTNAATVTQSVMTYLLDSRWVAANPDNNGGVAIDRLAEDVSVANAYDLAHGQTLPTLTFDTNNGNALITPNTDGVTFAGTWVGGSASGTATQNSGTLDLSGLNNSVDWNGAAVTMADGSSAILKGYDITAGIGFNDTLTLENTGDTVTMSGSSNILNMTGIAGAVGANSIVMVGFQENISFSTTVAVDVAKGGAETITGTDGTMTVNNGATPNTILNTINWNSGGSQTQNMASGLSNTQEVVDNFSGANGTGTLNTQVYDWSTGGSQQVLYTGLGSNVALQYNDFSGANLTGVLNNQIWNWQTGGSQEALYTGLGSGVALQYNDYALANLNGALNNQIWNWQTGGSQEALYTGLGTNVALQYNDYSGANLTGALNNQIWNWQTGGSQEALYTGLGSGVALQYNDYALANLNGALNNQIWNWTGGGSQEAVYTNLQSGVNLEYNDYSAANLAGTLDNQIFNMTAGGSHIFLYAGLPSGVTSEGESYSGANWTGTLQDGMMNYSGGNSSDFLLTGLANGLTERDNYFTGRNCGGFMTSSVLDNTDHSYADAIFEWGNGNTLNGVVDKFYNSSGTMVGEALFNAAGQETYAVGAGGAFVVDSGVLVGNINEMNGGGYTGGVNLGGGYELAAGAASAAGTNIGVIAQLDTKAGNSAAAHAAQTARSEIALLGQLQSTGDGAIASSALYESAKWNSKTITWSLAGSAGTADSPFSSYMGPQYAALLQKAFGAWGAASGLTFEQVADSSQSDIRIGWGDFGTASSGVVAYTSYQSQNGQFQPNVIIRLEDPSETSLVGGASANATYSGTQANLYQAMLHEIGHALGLADNADASSVMYYQASSNTALDSNDVEGMQVLYNGATPSAVLPQTGASTAPMSEQASFNSMLQQLAQASAAFGAEHAATSAFVPPTQNLAPMLAASHA